MPKKILILCTGNSCRSQMAQVILNQALAGQVQAFSAGTQPQAAVAAGALTALQQAGLDTAGLYPKTLDSLHEHCFDLVVTVCDHAQESCPVFSPSVKQLHLSFHDPHGEEISRFIAVRDDISQRLVPAVCAALGLTASL